MPRVDNYALQAQSAKARFLTYDQEKLIRKFDLPHDDAYLYPTMLGQRHRLSRTTGDLERQTADSWVDANSFHEIMTLLDMLCDSQDLRCLSGRWKQLHHFGLLFHQNLTESNCPFLAEAFDRDEAAVRKACAVLGAHPIAGGDFGCAVELFDGLPVGLLFWHGDEEFSPRLRWFWDDNSLQYIRYETMYYAVELVENRLRELL